MCAPLIALAACGSSSSGRNAAATPGKTAAADNAAPAPVATNDASPAVPTAVADAAPGQSPATPVSCASEIGAAAAQRKVKACLNVSPATHPPCNVANSCAMIDDEIARSCALFDGKGAPMADCKPAPKSMEAAAAVVQRYYSALNAHDYGTAWQQWGDDGPPNQTQAKFEAGFAHTKATHVTIGAMQPGDGAAGSIYQTVPVTVDATLDDGTHQRFAGNYVIRRVNDVDGASPGQLRWHIDSAHLAPAK
ncbi:hypothetical protein DMC47_42680 [Nostoc sp. 3335mG]|nr:hypothetical protein DMC47_42680 [Nostoc sp. 3335mG]